MSHRICSNETDEYLSKQVSKVKNLRGESEKTNKKEHGKRELEDFK
jgi:hypothetical protein